MIYERQAGIEDMLKLNGPWGGVKAFADQQKAGYLCGWIVSDGGKADSWQVNAAAAFRSYAEHVSSQDL
ncbi:MAG: hypothetical protein VXZ82_03095 [Planctomycetota bacterium]|nr:hypothetical protein [Planctomycetota bacterium]